MIESALHQLAERALRRVFGRPRMEAAHQAVNTCRNCHAIRGDAVAFTNRSSMRTLNCHAICWRRDGVANIARTESRSRRPTGTTTFPRMEAGFRYVPTRRGRSMRQCWSRPVRRNVYCRRARPCSTCLRSLPVRSNYVQRLQLISIAVRAPIGVAERCELSENGFVRESKLGLWRRK